MARGEPLPPPIATVAELESISRIVSILQDPRLVAFNGEDLDAGANEIVRILEIAQSQFGNRRDVGNVNETVKGAEGEEFRKIRKKWKMGKNSTKSNKTRQLSGPQSLAVALLAMGKSDAEAAKVCGRTRGVVNEWKNHDLLFQSALNIERNRLARATMGAYQKWMSKATVSAINEVGKQLRGDIATSKWLLEKVGIENFARQIFEQAVNPTLAPEDLATIIDTIAEENVDAFLTAKGVSPLERLRLREALTAKEEEALREECGAGDDAEE